MEDKPGPRKTTIQDSCEAKPTIINFENKYNISNDVLDGIFSEENKATWRKEVEKEHKPVQPLNQKVSEIKKICNKRVIHKLTNNLKFVPVLFILYLYCEPVFCSLTGNVALRLSYAMAFSTCVSYLMTKIGG